MEGTRQVEGCAWLVEGDVPLAHLVRVAVQLEHFRMHTQLVSGANYGHFGTVWMGGRGGEGEGEGTNEGKGEDKWEWVGMGEGKIL